MNFKSDNVTGASPEIIVALAAANAGTQGSYGADDYSARVEHRLAEIFEHDVTVFPVATGSAANALALACLSPPWGSIFCHESAHVSVDECGAPEFYTGGGKLVLLPGADGKISAADLADRLPGGKGNVHHVQPAAVSLTQATEAGTVYTPAEIGAITEVAGRFGLPVHLDGARFANALVTMGCSAAEMTWKSGIDVVSFGATKNGALAAEAVVFFDSIRAEEFAFRRKRGGHLFSKMRFLSAQLDAYLTDDLWLKNARHANQMAARLAEGLRSVPGARLRHKVEANEIFVELPDPTIRALEAAGFGFYRWDGDAGLCIRLVTAFNTTLADVDGFIASALRHGG